MSNAEKEMKDKLIEIMKQLNEKESLVIIEILKEMSRKAKIKQVTLNTRIGEDTNNLLRSYVVSSNKSIAFITNEALKEYLEGRQ